ncbi:MHC class II antigen presentation inhibitor [Eastern grey kangaroopox virus]|uniref:MHC class II antigen presentation inhibitor n=1 Tax=Eastern grey kangaroopox virus TaxID=2042482 RepID=A0A2C9DTA8_9POXV|nr:MHC class II antigen presentation inhibitor [Eastern grey kangaroopox virus]ATI21241.1 MHC class II antigen presentation inhibitor [Eastern grey kangaroopox virus]ATX75148.1 MHC class II antigen presentation inhibitor [Eastern grey kangaroopox virus]
MPGDSVQLVTAFGTVNLSHDEVSRRFISDFDLAAGQLSLIGPYIFADIDLEYCGEFQVPPWPHPEFAFETQLDDCYVSLNNCVVHSSQMSPALTLSFLATEMTRYVYRHGDVIVLVARLGDYFLAPDRAFCLRALASVDSGAVRVLEVYGMAEQQYELVLFPSPEYVSSLASRAEFCLLDGEWAIVDVGESESPDP